MSTLDLLPTFARLVRTPPPAKLDGHDQLDLLLGTENARSSRTSLYSLYGYKDRRLESLREGHWKLHFQPQVRLFDLQKDLGETTDVSNQHPDLVKALTQAAQVIRESTLNPQ